MAVPLVSTCLGSMAYPCMALEHRIQVPKCGVCTFNPKTVVFTPAGDPAGTNPLAPWSGWLGEWVGVGGSLRPVSCIRCPKCTLKTTWGHFRGGYGGSGGGDGCDGGTCTCLWWTP
jgi:hypothetical protein